MTSPPDAQPEALILLASRSDVGQVRSANEDSCGTFLRSDGTRLLVVADGMGGARGGATASQAALSSIAEIFDAAIGEPQGETLDKAIRVANTKVFELAQRDSESNLPLKKP